MIGRNDKTGGAAQVTALQETQSLDLGRLPAAARWPAWQEALDRTHLPWSADPRCAPERFRAELAWRQAGALSLVACSCAPCAGRRERAQLRRTESECFVLLLLLEGREAVRQGELAVRLGAGDLLLWDSARPIAFELLEPLRKVSLLIPKAHLQPLLPRGLEAAPLLLPAELAEAALLRGYLETLSRIMQQQEEAAWQRSAALLPELLSAALAAERPVRTSRAEALRLTVEAAVRREARDPGLCPEGLARRHGISTRYLHKLFEREPYSLAELILAVRLEGARRDLQCGAAASVTEAAFAWGFQSAAHFSRRFRQRFGCPPSSLR